MEFKVLEESGRQWLKEVDYKICGSIEQFRNYLKDTPLLPGQPCRYLGADSEYNNKNIEKAKPVCFTFSNKSKSGLFVPVGHIIGHELNLPIDEVIGVMKDLDATEGVRTIWWHYGSDSELLIRNFKWEPANWEDGMFAAYLENPNLNVYGLKDCGRRMLQLDTIEYNEIAQGRTLDLVHPQDLLDYACQDSDLALRIFLLPNVQAALKQYVSCPGSKH